LSREAASLYDRWDEHVRSCLAGTSVTANPGRIRFGGSGPERSRFGGRVPELFKRAFAYEGRTLKGNKAQGSIGPTQIAISVDGDGLYSGEKP
jgi:hypothetical protein